MTAGWAALVVRALWVYGAGSAVLWSTGLPTYIAARVWQRLEKPGVSMLVAVGWPLIAFSLFAYKVGLSMDLWFAAYWLLIPVAFAVCSASHRASHLFKGFVCSLVAHSVGSLVVLYAGVPVAWAALVPVVWAERLVAAGGMAFMAYVYDVVRAGVRARVSG